jgi:hypothetical protein
MKHAIETFPVFQDLGAVAVGAIPGLSFVSMSRYGHEEEGDDAMVFYRVAAFQACRNTDVSLETVAMPRSRSSGTKSSVTVSSPKRRPTSW